MRDTFINRSRLEWLHWVMKLKVNNTKHGVTLRAEKVNPVTKF